MEVTKSGESGMKMLKNIVFTAKRNIWLILAVLILAMGLGGIYSYFAKPVYTATQKLVYVGTSSADNVVSDYNAMNIFVGTVVDFCDEEVVLDRASFYYHKYLNEKINEGEDYTVKQFWEIHRVLNNIQYSYDKIPETKLIHKKNISIVSEIKKGETPKFIFTLKYRDADPQAAKDKVFFIVKSINEECDVKVTVETGSGQIMVNKYFYGLKTQVTDLGTENVTSSISKGRILIISALVGCIIAALLVYLKTIMDNAVRSKEDLEEMTGVPVFSFLDNKGGK